LKRFTKVKKVKEVFLPFFHQITNKKEDLEWQTQVFYNQQDFKLLKCSIKEFSSL
jgi:hypothetical protein